jgi:hypothetical protein
MRTATVTNTASAAETHDLSPPMIVIAIGQAMMSFTAQPRRNKGLVNPKICLGGAFYRRLSMTLSILVLASGCSRKAPTPTEAVVRPVNDGQEPSSDSVH